MRIFLLAILLLGATADAPAQPTAGLPFVGEAEVPELSEFSEVTLLTMLPGEEVYTLFGHTALRVRDPALGFDRTYNYGTFDFNQPNFVLRFLRGFLDYQLAVSTFDRTLAEYVHVDRPVIEQRLALDRDERQAVFLYLETNLLPENRTYRYDFLFDNCSTRPLDAIEWALGERLSLDTFVAPEGTFRDLLAPYLVGDPVLAFGIDLGLGRPVDREPTPREAVFLPLELFRAAEAATIDGRPLVAATDTLFWVEAAGLPMPAPDLLSLALAALLAAVVVLTILRPGVPVLLVIDVVILIFAGLAGLLLALLWFATAHHVTRVNVDLLWAWPTHLVAAVWLIRSSDSPRIRVYWALAAAGAGAAAILGVIGILALPSAAIPIALILAVRCADHARRTEDVLSAA